MHRDVKPSNVLLEREAPDLCVTLTDFGLVRALEASETLTQTASILGTPTYLAPEQADPEQWGAVTPLTDVYALGVITYEMLVGQPPFVGELAALLHAHANKAPTLPLELASDLDEDLATVLMRALSKTPTERYPKAAALVAALNQVVEAQARRTQEATELAQLLRQAQEARVAGDWLAVQSRCVQAMNIDRAHPDALALMNEATAALQRESAEEVARRARARRYEEGEAALTAGRWQEAIDAFEAVAAGNPDFRAVQEKLAQTRDEQQREGWYDEAIAHSEAERWDEACHTWLKVLRGRTDYREGQAIARLLDAVNGLLKQHASLQKGSKYEKQELERAHQALADYDALFNALEARDWKQAVKLGQRLSELAPDLERPQTWLVRARTQLEQRSMIWEQDGKEMVCVPRRPLLVR